MQLFYREKGHSKQPPLIILHGLWGASDNWLTVAEALSGFHVILPDLRNHGHSPHHAEHTYTTISEDIREFIQQLQLPEKPVIVGHSMGGKCLMHMLLKYPNMARKAVVIDIAPKAYGEEDACWHRNIAEFLIHFPFLSGESRSSVHHRIRAAIAEEDTCQLLFKNLRKEEKQFGWRLHAKALSQALPELMAWTTALPPCPIPVLFIRGERSTHLTPEDQPFIRSLFPHATFATIPNAGHRIHAEQPDNLAEILRKWAE